jgi:hypothetical protein
MDRRFHIILTVREVTVRNSLEFQIRQRHATESFPRGCDCTDTVDDAITLSRTLNTLVSQKNAQIVQVRRLFSNRFHRDAPHFPLLSLFLQVWLRYTTAQQGQVEDSNFLKITYPERQYSALQDEFELINEVEKQSGKSLVFLVDVEIPVATPETARERTNAFHLLMSNQQARCQTPILPEAKSEQATSRSGKWRLHNEVIQAMKDDGISLNKTMKKDKREKLFSNLVDLLWCFNELGKGYRWSVRLPKLVSERFLGFSATGNGATKHAKVRLDHQKRMEMQDLVQTLKTEELFSGDWATLVIEIEAVIDGQSHHLFNAKESEASKRQHDAHAKTYSSKRSKNALKERDLKVTKVPYKYESVPAPRLLATSLSRPMRCNPRSQINEKYAKVNDAVMELGDYEFLCLDDFAPEPSATQETESTGCSSSSTRTWKETLPFRTRLFLTCPHAKLVIVKGSGNQKGSAYVVKSTQDIDLGRWNLSMERIRLFHSPEWKKWAVNGIAEDLKNMQLNGQVRFTRSLVEQLLGGCAGPREKSERDDLVSYALSTGEYELLADGRKTNGRDPMDVFQSFWQEMDRYITQVATAAEDRRGGTPEQAFFPEFLCVRAMRETVKSRLRERRGQEGGSNIDDDDLESMCPSAYWISLQFMPSSHAKLTSHRFRSRFKVC